MFATTREVTQKYTDQINLLQLELEEVHEYSNLLCKEYNTARKCYESNRCTRYYFRVPGKKYDEIKCIQTPWGTVVDKDVDILKTCYKFYHTLYTVRKPSVRPTQQLFNKFWILFHLIGLRRNSLKF